MKQFVIVASLLLVPSIAFAYDDQWTNHFEGVAGSFGNPELAAATCDTAKARANEKAMANNCSSPYYTNKHGVKIGQVERCDCQCVDAVCICTDKLDVYCLIKDVK